MLSSHVVVIDRVQLSLQIFQIPKPMTDFLGGILRIAINHWRWLYAWLDKSHVVSYCFVALFKPNVSQSCFCCRYATQLLVFRLTTT